MPPALPGREHGVPSAAEPPQGNSTCSAEHNKENTIRHNTYNVRSVTGGHGTSGIHFPWDLKQRPKRKPADVEQKYRGS
ncbi:hypothetical protein Y1Q_0019683 [Alligator mississippiensis]|uniref:Uncharacterized protein n=1 Tax=Alligator mississippiensis TaxID=8496 RepID=A0A151PEX8_ALLMI|nr:hypothetical protein Y1Q_0019683 [Alligator mississippiensis]